MPEVTAREAAAASRTGALTGPLSGIRVLDLSRMVAGNLTGMLLGDFGADVVKIEHPRHGDPLRQWSTDGVPYWWHVYGRNKRLITLDLKSAEGRALLERMVPRFDMVIESFVPGTLEAMGLGWDTLSGWNPGLILLRISGWGQTGPGRDRPGFGTLIEAASGFAAMNGEPDGAPIVPAYPMADMAAGLFAANAAMFALYNRDVRGGTGQQIDVSLFESLFSLLGPLPAEYAALGRVRTRQGSRSNNSAPRGCFETSDGGWIAVSGSTPKMAERFLRAYALDHLLDDPRFATNEARVTNGEAITLAVADAIGARTLADNREIIARHSLTAVPVQTIADIETDPHWRARGLLKDVDGAGGPIRMHDVVPRLSETPGAIASMGGALGSDNHEFYTGELGLTDHDLARLSAEGVI